MEGRCNVSQDTQNAWNAEDMSLASGDNADGSDAGSVFTNVPTILVFSFVAVMTQVCPRSFNLLIVLVNICTLTLSDFS